MRETEIECCNALRQNLMCLMLKNNISQKELSQRAEIAEATMALILKGKRNPSFSTVYKIAKALNVSIDSLVGLNGRETIDVADYRADVMTLRKIKELLGVKESC